MSGFEPGLHFTGQGGKLIQGWNEITEIRHWVGSPGTLSNGGPGMRITVGKHEPDPYWFEHYDDDEPLQLEIKIGKVWVTKPARVISKAPLVIEAWQEEE